MINKEFIIGNGAIVKDFIDRNIPEYSHNFVSVGVLIPVSEFAGKENYSVELAVSKKIGSSITTLPSLICYSAKTIRINGVDYIKWQCELSISYTNFIGQLFLTPYIVYSANNNGTIVVIKQSTYTTATLNVIKGVESTNDASMEEQEAIDYVIGLINDKQIKTITDYANGTEAQAIGGCFENYNATYYDGWVLIVKYDGGQFYLMPYKNDDATEYTMLKGAIFYKLSNYNNGSYDEEQLTLLKSVVETALNGKVDKTTTINGYDLSQDRTLTKGDVGLGNVENYGIVNSPSQNAQNKYVDAYGLWLYLQTNYASLTDYNETKQKINEVYALLEDTDASDTTVNTIKDLLALFNNFPEGADILTILSNKANQSDLEALENRVEVVESVENVVVNLEPTLTILSTDWTSNIDSYSNLYPYKATYQSDLLKGAENVNVIFNALSDTSLLSSEIFLDNATGVITFYATDIPSDILVDKITAISTIGAISTISSQAILKISQLENDVDDLQDDVADIINTKLPLYELKQESLGSENGTKTFAIVSGTYIQQVKYGSGATLRQARFRLNKNYAQMDYQAGESAQYNAYVKILKEANSDKAYIEMQTKDHTLKLDSNGLTLDGNAVGGKQLYQHNIRFVYYNENNNSRCVALLTRITDKAEAYTQNAIRSWISQNGKFCSGYVSSGNTPIPIEKIRYIESTDEWQFVYYTGSTSTYIGATNPSPYLSFTDDVETI